MRIEGTLRIVGNLRFVGTLRTEGILRIVGTLLIEKTASSEGTSRTAGCFPKLHVTVELVCPNEFTFPLGCLDIFIFFAGKRSRNPVFRRQFSSIFLSLSTTFCDSPAEKKA